jgi:hypothetical protein
MTHSDYRRKPVLRQKHFSGLQTQLRESAINFCASIGPDDRECRFATVEEVDPGFAERSPTKVVVNPRRPSLQTPEGFFRNQQRRYCPDEHVNVGYGLCTEESKRPTYDRMWVVEIDLDGIRERQDLVAVAFGRDSGKPVIFLSRLRSPSTAKSTPRICRSSRYWSTCHLASAKTDMELTSRLLAHGSVRTC